MDGFRKLIGLLLLAVFSIVFFALGIVLTPIILLNRLFHVLTESYVKYANVCLKGIGIVGKFQKDLTSPLA